MKLTQKQVAEAYQAIVSQDETFLEMIACAAIESALETQADMWIDDQPSLGGARPVPGVSDAKQMAKSFTEDMMKDFKAMFDEAVDKVVVKARHRLLVNVSFGETD